MSQNTSSNFHENMKNETEIDEAKKPKLTDRWHASSRMRGTYTAAVPNNSISHGLSHCRSHTDTRAGIAALSLRAHHIVGLRVGAVFDQPIHVGRLAILGRVNQLCVSAMQRRWENQSNTLWKTTSHGLNAQVFSDNTPIEP